MMRTDKRLVIIGKLKSLFKRLFLEHSGEKGFTLVELLIAVAIIGTLAAVVQTNLGSLIGTGTAEAKEVERRGVANVAAAYVADGNVITNPFTVGPDGQGVLDDYLTGTLQYTWLIETDGGVAFVGGGRGEVEAVSRWGFNQGEGTTIFDSDGGNSGSIAGAVWVDGINGSALGFDGEDDYVEVPDSDDLDITEQLTIMAWAKPEDQKTAKVAEKGDWDGYGIGLDKWQGWKGSIHMEDGSGYGLDWGEGRPELGEWYQIALTYDGEKLTLYVNGEEKDSTAATGSLKVTGRPVTIGADGGAQKFFNGSIDEVSIMDIAMTAEEIKQSYNTQG